MLENCQVGVTVSAFVVLPTGVVGVSTKQNRIWVPGLPFVPLGMSTVFVALPVLNVAARGKPGGMCPALSKLAALQVAPCFTVANTRTFGVHLQQVDGARRTIVGRRFTALGTHRAHGIRPWSN